MDDGRDRAQIFSRRLELGIRLGVLVLFLFAPALVAYGVWRESAWQQLGEPVDQPIHFSHKHHVGDVGLDCRYCHTQVETSRQAGLPGASICMTCHSQLYADAAVLRPLRESVRTGLPIAWRRVHTLPDFVFFDHAVHVGKGVACFECHGRIDQMPITWRAQPLQMQWCVGCHRDPAPHLHAHDDVFAMPPPRVSAEDSRTLAQLMHLESTRRLTDCSTCHR